MSLFHRIKSPFSEPAEEETLAPEWPVHSVGEMLRERREELGLDLETAGEALRVKPIFLAALEQGRPQDLPGSTYAVGFIRAYAHYLGFDAVWMLDRYKAETTEVHLRPDLSLPVPLSDRSLPGGPILLVAAILALCGYGTWYYLSTAERSRPERVAAVPAALQRELKPVSVPAKATAKSVPPGTAAGPTAARPPGPVTASAAAGPAPASAPPGGGGVRLSSGLAGSDGTASGQPTEAGGGSGDGAGRPVNAGSPARASVSANAPPEAPAGASVVSASGPSVTSASGSAATADGEIDIRALADCWIQVRAPDQTIVFSRVLRAGETYRVPRAGLIMRVGNAGALTIAVGGKIAPVLGPLGVLRRDVVLDPEALLDGTAVHG